MCPSKACNEFAIKLNNLIFFVDGLSETTALVLAGKSGKKSKTQKPAEDGTANVDVPPSDAIRVTLNFKRYVYDPKKLMIQK